MIMSTIVEKNRILSIDKKNPNRCDVIDGSVLNGVRQPIFYIFVLDKPPGSKIYCLLHYKRLKLELLNELSKL